MSGDRVIVSKIHRDWACSWYQPRRGRETVGWLPLSSLKIEEPDTHPSLEKWINEWTFHDNTLSITRGSGAGELQVEGQASWTGSGDTVRTGEIDAHASPERNTLVLESSGCKMWLGLVGDFLVANDNHQCGGLNVVFDGVYRRTKE